MKLWKYFVIILSIGFLSSAYAESITVPDIDVKVDSISTLGSWEEKDEEGEYRFILYRYGFEHARGELWVQWLRWEIDKDGLYTHKVIAAEAPIKQVNVLGFALELPQCIVKWPCSEFNIMAYSTFESVPNKKFKFVPSGIGRYEVQEIEL